MGSPCSSAANVDIRQVSEGQNYPNHVRVNLLCPVLRNSAKLWEGRHPSSDPRMPPTQLLDDISGMSFRDTAWFAARITANALQEQTRPVPSEAEPAPEPPRPCPPALSRGRPRRTGAGNGLGGPPHDTAFAGPPGHARPKRKTLTWWELLRKAAGLGGGGGGQAEG